MPYRPLWLIDMGDGTWAVCCMACRLGLYRGPKRTADRVFATHRCQPVLPSAAAGRPDLPTPGPVERREPRPAGGWTRPHRQPTSSSSRSSS